MKKQRIFLAAALICCLALAGGGTLAFFTAQRTAYNVITTGELAMDLVEMHGDEPWPKDGVSGVMPGDEISKRVTIQNIGGVDFYTRVKLSGLITKADGTTELLSLDQVELDINTADWTEKDGFFYYNRSLAPRGADGVIDETEPLFTRVTLKPELGNAYQNARIELTVEAEAVQSRNNGDGPLSAAGWTLEADDVPEVIE